MALSERMQAHMDKKPRQGTPEMVTWLSEQNQIRAEERPKGKNTSGRRFDPGGEQERLKEAARKKAEKRAKRKARHDKTRAKQKARAEKAQQEGAERKSRREARRGSPGWYGKAAGTTDSLNNQGQPGDLNVATSGDDGTYEFPNPQGLSALSDLAESAGRSMGEMMGDRSNQQADPWQRQPLQDTNWGPGSTLNQLGTASGVMGDQPVTGTPAGAMGDPGDPGLGYELSGPTGRTDMGPAQDFQFGSPRLGEPLPTNQEFRGPQPESAANYPPEYVPAPDDPRMRMNEEYGEIRTPLPADPSLVGGTIQQGTTRTDPLTGQQTDFPGPTEPLMVSPITPEEFGAGMPPQMPPVIPGGFDPLEGPAMPMDPMQGAVPEAMPEYGAMAPLGMEDLPPDAAMNAVSPGSDPSDARATGMSMGGYGPTYGAHETTWFPPDHPGMQRPAPATLPEPQGGQPVNYSPPSSPFSEEMSPVLPPRLEPDLRGLMNKAQTPSAFGGSDQSQAYRDMFPNRQQPAANNLASLSTAATGGDPSIGMMPNPLNTGSPAGPGLGGGVRTKAPRTTRFNV